MHYLETAAHGAKYWCNKYVASTMKVTFCVSLTDLRHPGGIKFWSRVALLFTMHKMWTVKCQENH